LEDIVVAGALADLVWPSFSDASDSAIVARATYLSHRHNLPEAIENSRNGRRLMADAELQEDVAWCQRLDAFPIVVGMRGEALVRLTA
jgi:phosphosulfolactate phosphohydrolase-like enzyme